MKKFLTILFLFLLFVGNSIAEERDSKLDKLFNQLKDTKDLTSAQLIEKEIWEIWQIHPSDDRRGFRLTELLTQGIRLMNMRELGKSYEVFSKIIEAEPDWAEAWNKRATVLYIMGNYEQSQNDINEVLKLEERHFGALSGQGLVQIKLKNYKKAIESYKEVEKLHPSMEAPKVMIPRIKKLIKEQSI